MTDVSKETTLQLIDKQAQEWRNLSANSEIALRVHKKIGSEQAIIDRFTNDMIKSEKALAELETIRKEVEAG